MQEHTEDARNVQHDPSGPWRTDPAGTIVAGVLKNAPMRMVLSALDQLGLLDHPKVAEALAQAFAERLRALARVLEKTADSLPAGGAPPDAPPIVSGAAHDISQAVQIGNAAALVNAVRSVEDAAVWLSTTTIRELPDPGTKEGDEYDRMMRELLERVLDRDELEEELGRRLGSEPGAAE